LYGNNNAVERLEKAAAFVLPIGDHPTSPFAVPLLD